MRAFLCAVIFASTAFAQQATPVIVAEVRSQPLREELTLQWALRSPGAQRT